jgi:nucleoside-diphosphate-sugar epimerase
MRIVITGATGFVGGALTRLLRARLHDVHAVVRHPERAEALADAGVILHRGDVTRKESMRAPMEGADAVFHVAGWYKTGVRDAAEALAVNVTGTRHVLELMRELGVPKGVYTSTLAVNSDTHGQVVDESYRFHGRHISTYDETKARAHSIAEDFVAGGLPLVILQPGMVYGPGDTSMTRETLRSYLQQRLPAVPKGAAYCWAHVDDIAEGHRLALERGQPGRTYFLAGPAHTLAEAFAIAEQLTGIPAPKVQIPATALRIAAALVRPLELAVRLPPAWSAETLRVLAGVTYLGRSDRAREELGWQPRSLRDGLDETLRSEMADLGLPPISARS